MSEFSKSRIGVPVLDAGKAPESKIYVMECTLTTERTETIGGVTSKKMAELNGYLSAEVLKAALDMMQKVVVE